MMLQFLTDFTNKKASSKQHANTKKKIPQDKKMMRSTSFDSIQSTTSTNWHEEKHDWSFKTDYVSFPSLDMDDEPERI
ncbi:unnamed protein product [Cunninghamella echinulata]